jgi:hypothetical protein
VTAICAKASPAAARLDLQRIQFISNVSSHEIEFRRIPLSVAKMAKGREKVDRQIQSPA